MKRKIFLVLSVILPGFWVAFSWPTYHYPAPAELRPKAHYLERIIRTPPNETTPPT
jgi:hypothetical protein